MSAGPRPIVVGVCAGCAGLGVVPSDTFEQDAAQVSCVACGGTGDLDAYRLLLAYDEGRKEVLRWLSSAAAQAAQPELSISELRRKVGP